VCDASERAAIDIDGGRVGAPAPVTLDNLDCVELICGPHRSICLDLTFAILPPIDGPYATLDLIAERYVLLVPARLAAGGGRRAAGRRSARSDADDRQPVGAPPDPGAEPRRAGLAPRAPAEPGRPRVMELARSVCAPLGAASAA
jgi:hypothetical protein